MNKKITMPELVELLAQKQSCTKREAENFVRELLTLMTETISSGETLRISGLGVFKPVWVEERSSVNVQSGKRTVIPGHYKLTFTPAKAVRDAVNEPFACFCVEELPDDAPIVSEPLNADEMADDSAEEDVVMGVIEETPQEQSIEQLVEQEEAPEVTEIVEPESIEVEEIAHSIEEEPVATTETPHPKEEHEAQVDSEVAEDVAPSVTAKEPNTSAADSEENTSKAYLKGIWIGVVATVIVLVAAIALLLLCFPTYRNHLSQLPEYANSFFADKEPQITEDTICVETDVVEHEVIDTVLVDTIVPIVVEPAVVPEVVDTIRRGVFLTNISYKHYGHKAFWVYIYEENSNIIPNPDNVPVGTVITIPSPQKYGIDANDTVAINVALEKAKVIKQRMKQ